MFFCDRDESIDHHFLKCPVAKFVWRVVGCTFGIDSFPVSMLSIHDWVRTFPVGIRQILIIGTSALCWSLWKARNAICFQNKFPGDPTNLVFSLCYWLDSWSILQKPDAKKKLLAASVILRKVVMDILNKSFGWNMHMRLEAG